MITTHAKSRGHRPGAATILGISITGLLLLVGCGVDDPADDASATLSIQVIGTLPATPEKDGPPALADMLARPERLSAWIAVDRLDGDGDVVGRLGGGLVDDVTVDQDRGVVYCAGTVALAPDRLVGSRHRISVELRYLGDQVSGGYAGRITLESGTVVDIDTLTIGAFRPLSDGRWATRAFTLCLSTPAVGSDLPCVNGEELTGEGALFDPASDRFSFSYVRTGVEWLQFGYLRTIIFDFAGGLAPTPIMRGTLVTGLLVPGRPEPLEVLVPLASLLDEGTGPGRIGEVMLGDAELRFADGQPPNERGAATLVRVVPAP